MEQLIRYTLEGLQVAAWTLLIGSPILVRDAPVLVERLYATGGVL